MNKSLWAVRGVACAAAVAALAGLSTPAPADGPTPPPPPITVGSTLPTPKLDGATGLVPLNNAAAYAWNAFIALNWPAQPGTRDTPAANQPFGQAGAVPVWETMRAKVELYPGNASPDVGPHGTVIVNHVATNGPDYGYGQAPDYIYSQKDVMSADGRVAACPGQAPVGVPAWIPLDETTQIGVNQTYAGVLPATDKSGFNSKPRLIRYAVKMNQAVYNTAVTGQYWYSGDNAPLAKASANYTAALASGQANNPATPYVDFAPPPTDPPGPTGIEVKTSWRPLTDKEAASGRFFKASVRYYETNAGAPCYREAEWGLVGMHLISFSTGAPWVIWSTFEQADNILSADGKPLEDADGRAAVGPLIPPTTPSLSSDPKQLDPAVVKTGGYCTDTGARLFFRENPDGGKLPSGGDICVNHRWHPIPASIIAVNAQAHQAIRDYLAQHGQTSSPWLYYKLVNAQGTPVDAKSMNAGTFSTTSSYYLANSTIETDYSLGMFTGDLTQNNVPSNVQLPPGATKLIPYYNTRLLPFQAKVGALELPLQMGGCAGCHGFAATIGQDFSFALGNNVKKPEPADAFETHQFRVYFGPR